jgi:hypothetical protein
MDRLRAQQFAVRYWNDMDLARGFPPGADPFLGRVTAWRASLLTSVYLKRVRPANPVMLHQR